LGRGNTLNIEVRSGSRGGLKRRGSHVVRERKTRSREIGVNRFLEGKVASLGRWVIAGTLIWGGGDQASSAAE